MALERLDDPDHPTFGMGQAAELLEVTPAFLRSLDAAGLLSPARSAGGHRRYSRNQLDRVVALREMAEQGHTLASAAEILDLRADLAAEQARHARTRDERDTARDERDTALDERDTARNERDTALDERDTARGQVLLAPDD
ncbi:MerR family transcriptional regulator [Actinomycetospora sp. TBRC 11914]|uniref:MerR family transcriptional regulator n=1 Tax=Actinomycetospora sp. TBRC 11914 TaxID=2729387 RepID=UPI00145F9EF2|nr:MerR family transcriptional regulator [Actinomycetospora sp. TBRC 11914]NMO88285.1 MerR family transcriptional regulator [Actinomycetospora sp. TBRC 11914]